MRCATCGFGVWSILDLSLQTLEIRYTAGPSIATNNYHLPIVRGQLTRNITLLFNDIRDEISLAFKDEIPLTEGACHAAHDLCGNTQTLF